MMRRHGKSGFMAGATVFPGGKVDDADRDQGGGRSALQCGDLLEHSEPELAKAFFVAAARELHEEASVLLARDENGMLPKPELVARVNSGLEGLRDGHRIDAERYHTLLADHGLTLALDLLRPIAHWVTPTVEPRRFDTYFFVGLCPDGQQAQIDGYEATDALWINATEAVTTHASGGAVILPPPTLHTLQRIAGLGTTASEVRNRLGGDGVGPPIEPVFLVDTPQGPVIAMPDDPLHPQCATAHRSDAGAERRNRFVLVDGRFSRQCSEGVL